MKRFEADMLNADEKKRIDADVARRRRKALRPPAPVGEDEAAARL
jgi:hypothetical protein